MPALPARTRSVTRLSACDPAATNACWPAGMTHFRDWSSLGLIRFRRRRQKNAVRLIDIARAWFWVKAQRFLPWKIATPGAREGGAYSQELPATAWGAVI